MAGLLQVPLFANEVLPSFISRLAAANGRDKADRFCRDVGIPFKPLFVGESNAIRRLADLVRISPEVLGHHAIIFSENHSVTMLGERLSKTQVAKNIFRFCPACLAEDEAATDRMPDARCYRRSHWLVRDHVACIEHESGIVELDPHSIYTDFSEQLERAQSLMQVEPFKAGRRKPTLTDYFVTQRLAGVRDHGDILNAITMEVALNVARLLGIAVTHGKDHPAATLSDEEKRSALNDGLVIIAQGGDAFSAALNALAGQRSNRQTGGGLQVFGRFSKILFDHYSTDAYDLIRSLVLKNAGSNAPLVRTKQAHETIWLTVGAIVRKTGRSRSYIIKRLTAHGYLGEPSNTRVKAEALALFVEPSLRVVQSKRARKILECDLELFDKLVSAGVVKRAESRTTSQGGRRTRASNSQFSEAALASLRDDILRACELDHKPGMLSLRRFSKSFAVGQTTLIQKILSGHLPGAVFGDEKELIDRIFLNPVREHPPEYLTATEAANELDIRGGVLSKLLKHDVIKCVEAKTKAQQFPVKLIRSSEVKEFKSRFVTIGQLQKSSGIDRNTIRRRMTTQGIEPVFPPTEMLACFIDRSDVDQILMESQRGNHSRRRSSA